MGTMLDAIHCTADTGAVPVMLRRGFPDRWELPADPISKIQPTESCGKRTCERFRQSISFLKTSNGECDQGSRVGQRSLSYFPFFQHLTAAGGLAQMLSATINIYRAQPSFAIVQGCTSVFLVSRRHERLGSTPTNRILIRSAQ